tara:strand:- start:123 stop:722 length:600 start_codon:yes stop_codon:yes gene_type:complete
MNQFKNNFFESTQEYLNNLHSTFTPGIIDQIELLAKHLLNCWESEKNIFICGNGGSAANAIHIANDLHYGAGACGSSASRKGLKIEALPSNSAVITCLGNDIGYENIFSHQLINKASKDDLLIVLSGSGNSQNIINALSSAKKLGLYSYAILGFSGGKCLESADSAIHFLVDDMQIAEDTQLIVGHLCMQWLTRNKPTF